MSINIGGGEEAGWPDEWKNTFLEKLKKFANFLKIILKAKNIYIEQLLRP